MAQNIFGRGCGGNDGYLAPSAGEHSQNIALGSIVDGDDATAWTALQTVSALAVPDRLGPLVSLATRDFLGEVHAFETGPIERPRRELSDVESSRWAIGNGPVWWSEVANVPGQPPRIDARNSDQPIVLEPDIQRLSGAVIGRRRNRAAQDEAAGGRRRGFYVFVIGTDIADMR